MSESLLCFCKCVSEEETKQAIKNGANDLNAIMATTGAGTGCGRCRLRVKAFADLYIQEKAAFVKKKESKLNLPKDDQQLTLF
ncbi:MAG: (2Fe-2S)-binding protein [Bacteroidota bacterium]|nr:(2Fe-2S)-binding protein [Bacteroidota bacterium]